MGYEADPAQMDGIRERLVHADPDVVFVGLGCPIGCGAALASSRRVSCVGLRPGCRPAAWSGCTGWFPSHVAWSGGYLVDDAPFALRLMIDSGVSRYSHS